MNHKLQVALYGLVLLLSVAGCRDEQMLAPDIPGGNTELPDGRVVYTLHTSSPDFARPATRTGKADEDNVSGDMWVFVFDATTTNPDDGLFVEAVKASDHQAVGTGASKRTVILKARTTPVTLFILDNAPTSYYPGSGTTDLPITDAASWGLTAGTTKLSEARTLINTVRLAAPSVSTVPYTAPSPQSIPLSIEKSYLKLDPSIDLGTEAVPLGLKRVLARLTVKKDFTSVAGNANTPPFTLKGATVYNAPRNASLFPVHKSNAGNLTNYVGSTGDEITGIAAATSDDTADNPIYLYPSAEADAANQPFVLIQAQYDTDTEDTYYKLAITPDSKPIGQVERNTAYRLLIKGCTGRGYVTIDKAIAAPPSNVITYNMEVTDLTSHDIQDNGQYFLAFSNSEYMFFVTGAATDLTVTTLSYKKTTGVTGSVTVTDVVGGTNPNPTITRNPFTVSGATDTSEDLNMTFPTTFKSCTLVVRYGNLTQRIPITRRYTLPSAPIVQTQFAGTDANYVYGTVEYPSPGMTRWVGLSTDNNPFTEGTDKLSRDTKGGFYLKLVSNNYADQDPENRTATIYLSRPTDKGRLRLYLKQDGINMSKLNDTSDPGFIPVVGAFWRADQTGERLVQITKNNITTGSVSLDGYWYTTNVYYGDNWDPENGDGVLVDNLPSQDQAIWTAGGPTKSGNDSGFDEDYPVSKSQYAEGEMTPDPDGRIYFRIGLEKPYKPIGTAPTVRYAFVVLAYTANGSSIKYQRMFIRQGEDADYLMRPQDPYGNTQGSWAKAPIWRPNAVKFSPYNLTDPKGFTNQTAYATQNPMPLRGIEDAGKLTDYPTKAGALFRYLDQNRAIRPDVTVTMTNSSTSNPSWVLSTHETCPDGYRRPFDATLAAVSANLPGNKLYFGSKSPQDSEVRQSLWLNPGTGNAGQANNTDNRIEGFYADGYFDRRQIIKSIGDVAQSTVGTTATTVAHRGSLFFNPNNYASVFFPWAGRIGLTGASNQMQGDTGTYLTATSTNTNSSNTATGQVSGYEDVVGNESSMYCLGNLSPMSGRGATTIYFNKTRGGSIRCVKDE